LVYDVPVPRFTDHTFGTGLAREFFRAFSNTGAMNLHIRLHYGDNEHHILESIFKGTARSLDTAAALDDRIEGALSTKGVLTTPPS
jgi:imidazoleglycerol-phosphate dehydratase